MTGVALASPCEADVKVSVDAEAVTVFRAP